MRIAFVSGLFGLLALGLAAPAMAQPGGTEVVIIEEIVVAEPVEVLEAPAPELNDSATNDLEAIDRCLSYYDDIELAEQEASCAEVIATGSRWQREAAYFTRAEMRVEAGRIDEAVADFDAIIGMSPRSTEAYLGRAMARVEKKQFDLAETDLKKAQQLAPMNASVHNGLCWALAMQGTQLDRALGYCNLAVGLAPNDTPAIDSRALVHLKMGKHDLALADYERAVRLVPSSAHYMYGRGVALLRLGRKPEGQRWVDLALKADPEVARVYAGYGVKP